MFNNSNQVILTLTLRGITFYTRHRITVGYNTRGINNISINNSFGFFFFYSNELFFPLLISVKMHHILCIHIGVYW